MRPASSPPPSHPLKLSARVIRAGLLPLLLPLAACGADSQRLLDLRGDPALCRPGTFIGSMTSNCPQPLR